jgi:hypothetical protein
MRVQPKLSRSVRLTGRGEGRFQLGLDTLLEWYKALALLVIPGNNARADVIMPTVNFKLARA